MQRNEVKITATTKSDEIKEFLLRYTDAATVEVFFNNIEDEKTADYQVAECRAGTVLRSGFASIDDDDGGRNLFSTTAKQDKTGIEQHYVLLAPANFLFSRVKHGDWQSICIEGFPAMARIPEASPILAYNRFRVKYRKSDHFSLERLLDELTLDGAINIATAIFTYKKMTENNVRVADVLRTIVAECSDLAFFAFAMAHASGKFNGETYCQSIVGQQKFIFNGYLLVDTAEEATLGMLTEKMQDPELNDAFKKALAITLEIVKSIAEQRGAKERSKIFPNSGMISCSNTYTSAHHAFTLIVKKLTARYETHDLPEILFEIYKLINASEMQYQEKANAEYAARLASAGRGRSSPLLFANADVVEVKQTAKKSRRKPGLRSRDDEE